MIIGKDWFKLDNAAKLFPAVTTSYNSSTFRVSATLIKKVEAETLQKALDNIIDRFPAFKVKIKRGLFWYYLEHYDKRLYIEEEINCPCNSMEKNSCLIKILYYNKKISLEVFHSITDGTGAIEMLKLLIWEYLNLSGFNIEKEGCILNPEDIPSKYELEDSFSQYYEHIDKEREKLEKAYQIEGSLFNNFGNNIVEGILDASKFKEKSKEYGVTITEYIVGLLVFSIYNTRLKYRLHSRPVNIVIPVNLRNILPSKSLRNFFTIITAGFKLDKDMEFKDLLKIVSRQIKDNLDIRKLSVQLTANYESERNILIRFVPLFIKNIIIKFVFNRNNIQQTACISNIGRIKIPISMAEQVERMSIMLYSTRKKTLNCGVCSVNNKLSITFSRTIIEADIIKYFFTYLKQNEGLDSFIYSNEWGTDEDM